jgi:hypothetical protein
MTQEQIDKIALQALHWAQGSWGQSQYDRPRYEPETMKAIYYQLAQLALSKADFGEQTGESK